MNSFPVTLTKTLFDILLTILRTEVKWAFDWRQRIGFVDSVDIVFCVGANVGLVVKIDVGFSVCKDEAHALASSNISAARTLAYFTDPHGNETSLSLTIFTYDAQAKDRISRQRLTKWIILRYFEWISGILWYLLFCWWEDMFDLSTFFDGVALGTQESKNPIALHVYVYITVCICDIVSQAHISCVLNKTFYVCNIITMRVWFIDLLACLCLLFLDGIFVCSRY